MFRQTDEEHRLFFKGINGFPNLTYSYNGERWSKTPIILDSMEWTDIFLNKADHTYWVAADRKIFHFDQNFLPIRVYTKTEGVPDLDLAGLIMDNNKGLWFHTDRSIHQLNTETGEISMLSEKDGYQKQHFEIMRSNAKDYSGNFYFPGGLFGSGFNIIDPSKYTTPGSSIYLRSFYVNQQPFGLPTGINDLTEVNLKYNENKITLETGTIDYYSKGDSRIRYKLTGVNDGWQYAEAGYTIRYDNLDPGSYSLIMQASNASYQFNGPEHTVVFNISPPWWATWWARTLFILLFGYLLWSYIQYL